MLARGSGARCGDARTVVAEENAKADICGGDGARIIRVTPRQFKTDVPKSWRGRHSNPRCSVDGYVPNRARDRVHEMPSLGMCTHKKQNCAPS